MFNLTGNHLFDYITQSSFFIIFIMFASISLSESALSAATQEPLCETVEVGKLSRYDKYNYKLAIKQSNGWLVFSRNDETNQVCEINFDNPDNSGNVIFKWAVPKSENKEFIYASSTVGKDHPLSLFRNSNVPFFKGLKPFGITGSQLKLQFIEFHHNGKSQLEKDFQEQVKSWHDTSLWFTKVKTEDLVKLALYSKKKYTQHEIGAERLIRIKKGRPMTSWIEFRSKKPKLGQVLTVTLFYSGDSLQSLPKYKFQFKEKK